MNLRHLLLIPCLCAGIAVAAEKPAVISADEASKLIASDTKPVILDVRTPDEFAEGHIAGAKLIPWTDGGFEARVRKELDPAKPVLVYCLSGKRSSAAAEKLASLGFTSVTHLKGGTLAWARKGLPLVQPR